MADRERTAELVLRSRRGDRAAFTELVRRYENAAYATALTYTHHVEDAQDIVQDAFVIAYCKLAQLREPEHFGTWLGTISGGRRSNGSAGNRRIASPTRRAKRLWAIWRTSRGSAVGRQRGRGR